jgi:hypothetical protein
MRLQDEGTYSNTVASRTYSLGAVFPAYCDTMVLQFVPRDHIAF